MSVEQEFWRKAVERLEVESKEVWTPQPGPQQAFIDHTDDIFEIMYGGARGGGKLSPLDSTLYTPTGEILMADARVGTALVDPATGRGQHIIGVYPKGDRRIWRFTFDDGAALEVGNDHRWLYRKSHHKKRQSKSSAQIERVNADLRVAPQARSRWDDYSVGYTHELLRLFHAGKKIRIPLAEPTLFSPLQRPLTWDPYLLGLMLGDGSHGNMTITSVDAEIIEYVMAHGFVPQPDPTQYYLPVSAGNLRQFLRKYDLDRCRAWEKFIPQSLKLTSVGNRIALLQGLMDTDGTVDKRGRVYYCSTSRKLAEDVQWIARSLGGKARLRERTTSYTYKGEKRDGRPSYSVRIWHPRTDSLFRLSRKKERCRPGKWNGGHEITRKLENVEFIGKKESQCIAVSGPRQAYIADDFVVSLNTDACLGDWIVHQRRYGSRARGAFFRRVAMNLRDVIRRSKELYLPLGATWNGSNQEWTFPNGANLKILHLWDEAAAVNYQGWALCVAGDTEVRMGDGSAMPIKEIKPGDMVMTLEGPRPVRRVYESGVLPAVRLEARGPSRSGSGSGAVVSAVHPMLATIDPDTCPEYCGSSRGLRTPASSPCLQSDAERDPSALPASWVSYEEAIGRRIGREGAGRTLQEYLQLPRLTLRAPLWRPPRESSRFQGASYVHPYTGALRHVTEDLEWGEISLQPCEPAYMYDLEVDSASHYILAANGAVVKNTRVYAEELQQWPDEQPIKMIKAILRSAEGVPVGFRASANPGGPGQNWVAMRYVFPAPGGYKKLWDDDLKQHLMFIPARLEDNTILMENDPTYEARLHGSGPEYLVKAWRYGDWNIAAGGYFDDVFKSHVHIVEPFEIPPSWSLRRSFDWGAAKPASLGLWAVSDGSIVEEKGLYFPRGSMIRIAEWYTAEKKGGMVIPNKGMRLSNQDLGLGIARISTEVLAEHGQNRFKGCIADPAIFTSHGGPSIYDQIRSASYMLGHRLHFSRADHERVAGWQRMRMMLQEAAKEYPEGPGMWVWNTCTDWIRTVPTIGRDERNHDDIDSKSEDHCADETRYMAMSGLGARVQVQEFVM